MRSSLIPRSLILVASAALSFGACATEMDPGTATNPATGGTPSTTVAGTPGTTTTAGNPATGAAGGGAKAGTGGGVTTGAAGTPAGTAGSPAGTAGSPAGMSGGTAGMATASSAAGMSGSAAGGAAAAAGMSGGAAGGGATAGGVTFTMVHETVLVGTGCAISACHGSAMGPSKLGLVDKAETYKELVGVKAMGSPPAGSMGTGCSGIDVMRVKAGDPDNSLLVQKLEGTQTCGTEMPPSGMLKPEQIKLVRDWIMAGAKDD